MDRKLLIRSLLLVPLCGAFLESHSQVAVTSVTVCVGATTTTLTASGAITYNWSTGQTTDTIIVSPASTTSYTVTGNGSATNTAVGTITVGPTAIATPSSPTICSQTATSIALSSNVGGTTFSWTESETHVSGASTGSGSTIAQTLTSSPINVVGSATYTITPKNGGCTGNPTVVQVRVNPKPQVTVAPTSPTICSGNAVSLSLSSSVAGTDFNWTVVESSTTGDSPGVNVPSPTTIVQTLHSDSGGVSTYEIIPTANGCIGNEFDVNVTVNRIPIVTNNPLSQTICSGNTTTLVTLTSDIPATFNWSASSATITGYTASGTTTIPVQTLTNPGSTVDSVVYAITVNGCSPQVTNYVIFVNPTPTITLANAANPSICQGVTTANLPYTATTHSPNQYSITYSPSAIASGFTNVTNAPLPASPIILTIPAAAPTGPYGATVSVGIAGTSCASSGTYITITVNPIPSITLGANPTICQGTTTANLPYSATTGTPDQYSVTYTAAALAAGFTNVSNAALTASPIGLVVPGVIAAGTYSATITVNNSTTGCISSSTPITVEVQTTPSITLGANPSVCIGAISANLPYTATTGSPNQYSIVYNATAIAAGFTNVNNAVLPASPIVLTVPGAAAAGTYNATLTVRNSAIIACLSNPIPITVTINPTPTITLGANPTICQGTTSANLPYTATTGTPNEYSIAYNAAALAAGFTNVSNAALTSSPIILTVPGAAAIGTYSGTLTVNNSITGCAGNSYPIALTIDPIPAVTLGANPVVCQGATNANLAYSSPTGAPNFYDLVYDAAALATGFTNVIHSALPASPIGLVIPAAGAAGTYNATVTVGSSVTNCIGNPNPITVTIDSIPTITLGANPSVCQGVTSANLSYSTTKGSPNQYSITYNAIAIAAGFTNVSNAVLPASPITLTVPGAAASGTYSGTLTVTNTLTACGSSSNNITVTINPTPTITVGANPTICQGTTSANLPYTATTGSPDQYSITYNAAALAAGFTNVSNAVLPGSPIGLVVPVAAPAAIYSATITVNNSTTGCTGTSTSIKVKIEPTPTIIVGANPSVCQGTTSANLPYSATTGAPDQYSITYNATAIAAGFANVNNAVLPASPIVLLVPGAAAAATYSATITVGINATGCTSNPIPITITINPIPTITLSANPIICQGTTNTPLAYSATTGTPDQYSITYSAAAITAGFANVSNAALTTSPIILTVPGAAAAGTYSATLTVDSSGTGCVGSSNPITITINPTPTITLGASPSICQGTTSANLPYTATTGTPDQYTITYSAAAIAAGFTNISNAALTTSPIILTVPGAAAAGTYSATLTVDSSTTGCTSNPVTISVTIYPTPTITLGANPSVCQGTTTANLPYTATTGSPNQYSVSFSATALSAGFTNVTNVALPASPITLTLSGAIAAGSYNATLTVVNSVTSCTNSSNAITVTIKPSDDASFTYSSGTYCQTDPNPTPTITGLAGGTFSSLPPLVFISTSTGQINLSGSAAGTYTVTYTTNGPCPDSSSIPITITSTPDPDFSYSGPYCTGTPNASPTFTVGASAGTFSVSPAGLVFVSPLTGVIDLTASVAGVYSVTNTIICGGIPTSFTSTVSINTTPQLSSTLTPAGICSGNTFSYTATSVTGGTTFSWSRATIAGITQTGTTGTGNISETLTNTTTAPINVTYMYIADANGCPNPGQNVIVPIYPTPQLSSVLSPAGICSGNTFSYTATSATGGATFNWSRATIAGITQAGTTGTGNVSEILTNTTTAIINVTYVYTTSANGCSNAGENVIVPVNPIPKLSSSLSPAGICSGNVFSYTATSATPGATFSWSRATIAGITQVGTSGTGNVSEVLTNTTTVAINVTYVYVTSANSCLNAPQNVIVVVSPIPNLTSTLSPTGICSGNTFSYTATSATGGATFKWSRATIAGITQAGKTGTGNVSEVLTNTTTAIINVTYTYITSDNGCPNLGQNVVVAVSPTPKLNSSLSPAGICSGNVFSYTATSATIGATFKWSRATIAGITQAGTTGTGNVSEVLTNTTTAAINVTYAYITSANGCPNSGQNVVVAVNPTPQLNSTLSPAGICSGNVFSYSATSTTAGSSFKWSRATIAGITQAGTTGTGNVNEVLTNTSVSPINVTYLYVTSANGCSNTAQNVVVKVTPLDIATFSYSAGTYCQAGSNPTPSITGLAGGTFSSTAGLVFISTSTGQINLSASALGTYTVTYTTNGSCPNSSSLPITITTIPNPDFTYSVSYCTGAPNAAPTFTAGASAGVFTSVPAGLVFVSPLTGVINLTTSTTGTYTVTNTITCSGTTYKANFVVTVIQTPKLSSSLSPAAICSGGFFNYVATSTTPGATFKWSRATIAGISEAGTTGVTNVNEILNNSTALPINVTYVYITSSPSCSNPGQNVVVKVNPIPQLSSTLTPAAVCSGNNVGYTATSATGGATFTWSRAAVAGIAQTGKTGTGTINETLTNTTASPVNVTYVYTTTANGCSNSGQNVIVSITPLDDATFSYSSGTYCQSAANPTPTVTGLSGGTFSSVPALVFVSTSTGEINLSANALGTYTVSYTTNGACPNSSSIPINITLSPSAGFSYSGPYCTDAIPNASPTFSVGASAGTFSVSPAGLVFVNSTTGVIDLTATTAGTYTVTNTVLNCAGVPLTATNTVTINQAPSLSSSLTATAICSATAFTYTASSSPPGALFAWSRATIAGITPAGTSAASNTINETLTNTTTLAINVPYSYTLTANGCVDTQNVTVPVNPIPSLSSTLTPAVVCSGTPINYFATSTTPDSSFTWTRATIAGITETGTSGTGDINETLDNTTTSSINVTYIYVTTANGCSNAGQNVVVTIIPVTTATPESQTICSGSSTSIVLTSPVPGTTFNWTAVETNATGAIPSSGNKINQTLSTTGPTYGTVIYTVVPSASGCAGTSITVPVTVDIPIVAEAGNNTTIAYGQNITIGGTPTGPAGSTYVWSPALNLNDSTVANPNASPTYKTVYKVICTSVVNSVSCSGIDSVIISVTPPVNPVNGFTPNGDGRNDVWVLDFLGGYSTCVVDIFNRWGELLFHSQGYKTPWDGTYNGQPLPVGTYYYVINLNSPLFPDAYTGPVTILR